MTSSDDQAVLARLQSVRALVVATHEKPDGDAVGSAAGLVRICRCRGIRAELWLPEPVPLRYRSFLEAVAPVRTLSASALAEFDALVLLDCARPERAALGPEWTLAQLPLPVINIDHHLDNSVSAAVSWVAERAATAMMVYELAATAGWTLTPEAATLLLLGLVTDTGSFRFSNTTPEAFRAAAALLEAGADQERVVNAVYFSKPRNQQEFETELLSRCLRRGAGGSYLYAVMPEELFARHHFDMRDGEGVIDLLREVEGVVIAGLFYARGARTKVSLRSKDARFPVGPLVRKFGGGGHPMAAGVTLELPPEEAAAVIGGEVEKLLGGVSGEEGKHEISSR